MIAGILLRAMRYQPEHKAEIDQRIGSSGNKMEMILTPAETGPEGVATSVAIKAPEPCVN